MKACFINPPLEDFYATSVRRQPLGLLYVIAAVRDAGFEVELINGHTPARQEMEPPGEFGYLARYRDCGDPALSFPFARYCHYGMSFQELERRIRASDADAYFVASMFTPYYREADRVIAMVKRHHPGAPVVVGGHHAALHADYCVTGGGADYAVTGEGEAPAVGLMHCLASGGDPAIVPGLAFHAGGAVVRTGRPGAADIERIALPARDLLRDRDFRAYGGRIAAMITSRGCPNRCDFCSVRVVWGDSYRVRGSDAVIREMRECAERFGATILNFEDDNLFASSDRAASLLEAIIAERENGGPRLDLAAMNGVSLERLDDRIVGLMARAGFREINLSLMSHSVELQKCHGRPFSSDQFAAVAKAARGNGMNLRAYFILGLPGQTADEVRETARFLRELGASVFPSVYYNVEAPRKEWLMQRSSAFFNETEELSRDDIVRLFNECSGGHNVKWA
jgi:radical SAM superfamily enzyme YgiQ (UPF0313 family)